MGARLESRAGMSRAGVVPLGLAGTGPPAAAPLGASSSRVPSISAHYYGNCGPKLIKSHSALSASWGEEACGQNLATELLWSKGAGKAWERKIMMHSKRK